MDWATWRTKVRSAAPSARGGVPTAMNTACASSMAGPRAVVKASRPAAMFLRTRLPRPCS